MGPGVPAPDPGFPDLIHENEFRSAVMGKFGAGIATDGWRGAVYTAYAFFREYLRGF